MKRTIEHRHSAFIHHSKRMFIQILSNRVFVSDVFFFFAPFCAIFTEQSDLKFRNEKWNSNWTCYDNGVRRCTGNKDDKLNGKQEEQQRPTQQSIKWKNEIFFDIYFHSSVLFGFWMKWVEDSLHVNNNMK